MHNKYWPDDDGLVRPKQVTNIWNNKTNKNSCDKRRTYQCLYLPTDAQ